MKSRKTFYVYILLVYLQKLFSFFHKLKPDVHSPEQLSVQQPSVLGDLHLQPGFHVQQRLVLVSLSLQVGSQLSQLLLQDAHLSLETRQHVGVPALGVGEGSFKRRFLKRRENSV